MSDLVLATQRLSKRFGALVVANDINFELRAGERRAADKETASSQKSVRPASS